LLVEAAGQAEDPTLTELKSRGCGPQPTRSRGRSRGRFWEQKGAKKEKTAKGPPFQHDQSGFGAGHTSVLACPSPRQSNHSYNDALCLNCHARDCYCAPFSPD
jgi:hypothetical protein